MQWRIGIGEGWVMVHYILSSNISHLLLILASPSHVISPVEDQKSKNDKIQDFCKA